MGLKVESDALFCGFEKTKNPEWLKATFKLPEMFKGVELSPQQLPGPNVRCFIRASESADFGLVSGAFYRGTFEVSLDPAKENYKAQLKFSLIDVKSLVQV